MRINVISIICGITMLCLLPMKAKAALLGDFNNDGVVSISEVQSVINSYLGVTDKKVFTTVMINGRSFHFVSSDSSGTIQFNYDHTLIATHPDGGSTGGTWSINSSGQLLVTIAAEQRTYTLTLTSTTATSMTATQSWPGGSDIMTFTGTVGT